MRQLICILVWALFLQAAFNKIPNSGPLLPLINGALVLGAVGYCGYNSVFTGEGGPRGSDGVVAVRAVVATEEAAGIEPFSSLPSLPPPTPPPQLERSASRRQEARGQVYVELLHTQTFAFRRCICLWCWCRRRCDMLFGVVCW